MWGYRALTSMVQTDDPRPGQAEVLPAVKGNVETRNLELLI